MGNNIWSMEKKLLIAGKGIPKWTSNLNTLKEVQVILTFATVGRQWSSMRKDILNDVEVLGRDVCKIILQKYT